MTDINRNEREQCFKNWALAKAQAKGIKEDSANGYISALNRMWNTSTVADKWQSPYEYGYNDLWNLEKLQSAFEANGDFKDADSKLGLTWYIEFLTALYNQPFGDELIKFRNLLKWFVWQVRVNNDVLSGGHHSGSGYNQGASIRNYYSEWREYDGFTLDCTIFADFRKDTAANNVYYTGTRVDITPVFTVKGDKKDVSALQITIKQDNKTIKRQYPPFAIEKLYVDNNDYEGDYCPYYLKDLFALFKEEIKFYISVNGNAVDGNGNSAENGEEPMEQSKMAEQPKNQILYGPPGTGKTITPQNWLWK